MAGEEGAGVENIEGKGTVKPNKINFAGNPWKLFSLILAVISIILAVIVFKGGMTGNAISEKEIGEKAVSFINSQLLQGRGAVTLDSVSETNGLYKVVVNYNNQKVPTYFTKDGELFVQGIAPVSGNADAVNNKEEQTSKVAQTEVAKSDKPKIELFVMTYCPYGTQAEKGIIPALKELGGKIDANIRFVHYFMHGDKEEQETYTQLCIREEQADKFLSYLECFLEDGNSGRCLAKAGVNEVALSLCEQNKAKSYYASDSSLSKGYGVQGSPTLIVNGAEAEFYPRSPANALETICSAFNNAPAECSAKLSDENPNPGFGSSGSATDNAGGSCG